MWVCKCCRRHTRRADVLIGLLAEDYGAHEVHEVIRRVQSKMLSRVTNFMVSTTYSPMTAVTTFVKGH
ncbi:hypothetical protein OAN61_00175 [bacterium]|nr:hypothetical protein [bacterium]